MGGRWMIGNKDLGGIFNPSEYPIGDVMLEYEVGSGNCLAKTTRKITIIPGTPLMLPQDTQMCQKDNPLALVAFPAGGVWAGSSVSSDNFDPSIGSGEYTLTYQYERSTDGCISEASMNVKVFEVPQINIPDSIAVCNTDKPLDINQLIQPNLNPIGGNLDWSGSGISGNFFQTQDAGGEGVITLTSEYYFLKGCSAIDSTVISIGPVPETQVGPDTSLCTNQGQYILEGTPAGGEWIGNNGAVVSSPLNLLTTPLGKTSYWYITAKGTSCENRDSFTLDLIDSKGLNAGDDLFVCENLTQIDLPNVNGSWSGPELSGARTINLQNLSIGTFTYTLLDNSLPKACNTDDIELTIHPLPQANFELPSLECTSSEFQIQNNSVGAEKFEWNFGDGRLNMENNPRLSFPISGNYRIKLEAIKVSPLNGQNICQTSLEKEIKIIDPPQKIDFSPSVNRVCSPLTTDFINKSIGENLKFSWDFGNGQTGNVDQPLSITYTAIGSDTIYKVILTADNGCGTIQDEMEVEVLAAPVARFASEFRDNYCSGEPIPFGHRSFGTELKWDFGNGNIYLGENPLPQKFFTTIDKSDTVIIFLEAKNQCGIDSALQPLIIVPTDARAAITLPKSKYCVGDTVILESLSRPVDGRSIWQLPDGAQFEGLKLSIPLLDTGSQVVKLKSLSCGEDSAQVSFQVFPLPNLSIDAPSVSCPGEKILIKSMTDGLLGPIFFNDSLLGITNFLELMVPQSSQGVIKTTSQNQAGCISSVEKLIQIVPGPMGNILIPDTICSKELFNLQSSSANNITCSWQLDGGVSIAGCQVSVSLDNHGLLDGNLIIQNDVGCRDSMFFNLFVREKPVADFDISVVEDCFPGTVILTNQSWGENGIVWLLPDGSLKNANSFLYEIGQSGKFNIGLRATRDQICFDEVYRTVEIYPLPDIKLNFQEGCTVESGFSLEVESLPNAVIELHGLVNGQGSFFDKLLKGEYWINAESREGCIKDTLIQIPEVREFKASIEGADSIEIIMGQNLNLIATVNETNVKSLWLPSLNSGLNEEVRPLRSGYIIFEAVNSRGCILRDSVFIRVEIDRETGIFIPQAFTPNNDGVNDIFMVRSSNPGLEKIADFKIFGPAGDLVFQMKDGIPNSEISGWNGELAQSGVYVYLAELEFIDGIKTIKKGDVTLIR
jgi:PKD repeat protein